jgi:phosphate-selective porin OprO and OprP
MVRVRRYLSTGVAFCFLLGFPYLSQAKSVNEKILDILLESKIVSQEKYQELKKQVEQEEAEVAKLRAAAEGKAPKGGQIDFNRGLTIKSADGENRIQLSGRFQGDYRHFLGDHPNNDSFLVRRARLAAIGSFYKYYDFIVEAEFGQGSAKLNDAYLNINYVPYAQLRFGQFKVPFLLDELRSDNWIDFVERSLTDNFAPSRDLGMMLHGNISKELVYYQLGISNGRQVNASSDVDDQKDVAGRITLAPFSRLDQPFLKNFHIGGAFTTGVEHTIKPSTDWWKSAFKTLGGAGTTFMQFQDTVRENGNRTRLGAELAWIFGPVYLLSEYATLQLNDLAYNNINGSFSGNSGYATLGWFLTGEQLPWKNGLPGGVVPKNPFVFGKGGTGAFQLLGRYDWLEMDKGLLEKGFVDAGQFTNKADGYTFGLTWYPNEIARFMLNYTHTNFGSPVTVSGKRLDSEDAFLTRFQIVW